MPLAVRQARLAGIERASSSFLLSDTQTQRKRRHSPVRAKKHKKSKPSELECKVEQLSSTVERLLPLLVRPPSTAGPQVGLVEEQPAPPASLSPTGSQSQPPDQEVMSVAASDTLFSQASSLTQPPSDVPPDNEPCDSGSDVTSGCSGHFASVVGSVRTTLKALLARLQLDTPVLPSTSENMFLRPAQRATLVIPQCHDFTSVVASALGAAAKSARPDQMSRILAAMQDPDAVVLGNMPVIESSVASLIVSPDEALRECVRCPNTECRRTDELLSRAYNSTAFLGRVSNSLAHMLVMLHSSLSTSSSDPLTAEVLELALQAMGVIANQCGTTLGTLVQARRQGPTQPCCLTPQACGPKDYLKASLSTLAAGLQPPTCLYQTWWRTSTCELPSFSTGRSSPPSSPPPTLVKNGDRTTDRSGPVAGVFTGGQLAHWRGMTSNQWILATLSRGYRLQFRRRPPMHSGVRQTVVNDPRQAEALEGEVQLLLNKGAIEMVDPIVHPGGFFSVYFLVPKKDGGFRPILDLRRLNRFLKVLPFRMLRTSDVLQVVTNQDWFVTIDLEDAYFHIPIAAEHRRFLHFSFMGKIYQFRVLPFGLSLAPRVFSKCIQTALEPLQKEGVRVLPYLYDWLVCAGSPERARAHAQRLLLHITALGFRVNQRKSKLDVINQLEEVLSFVGPDITKQHTNFREPIEAKQRLTITIRYLASGDSMHSMAYDYRVGVQTVSDCIHLTTKAIKKRMMSFLPRPTRETREKVSQDFWEKWDFPNCLGSWQFKWENLAAQVTVGFSETDLARELENQTLNISPPNPLPGAAFLGDMPHVIVAGAAFPLKSYLLKPYGGRNLRLSRGRMSVEKAFGILVATWRIFLRRIHMGVEKVDTLVMAACILHNFLSRPGDAECSLPWQGVHFPNSHVAAAHPNRGGQAALTIRDKFVQYFTELLEDLQVENGDVVTFDM
ncbi:hypothetical protein ACEWY4_016799 [Coilia grayii]|uniref:ribonuclease H n=1 Tax=Coilia grayii TaxID=363190 RepID=A0ABD1JLG2_9TELE